jgi:alpha-glucosidase
VRSFDLLSPDSSARYLRGVIERFEQRPAAAGLCWALSNHDVVRLASR